MTNKVKKYNELAPCGVYCGACPSFDKTCLGCASEDKTQDRCSKWGCKIRNCCYNLKGLDYCVSCEQFPCKIFNKKLRSTYQDDPRFTYRYELPELLNKFKTLGVKSYINFHRQRWKCDSCGGTIRFYHYKCDKCGKEMMIK